MAPALLSALRLFQYVPAVGRLALAQLLAWLLGIIPNRRRDRAAVNIQRCLPELTLVQQRSVLQQHLLHRSRSLLETPLLWHAPPVQLFQLITRVDNQDLLETARARGRGVIVAVPHFGQWELIGLLLSATLDNTAMLYKPPPDPQLDEYLRRQRQRTGGLAVPADGTGIRQLLKILRSGGFVGILPDQRPKAGHGETARFFDQPVSTMTLLSRLVRRTGCSVVFAACERCSNGREFILRYLPAPFGIDADDNQIALAALNQGIEQCARLNLAQYQWSYKRFAD